MNADASARPTHLDAVGAREIWAARNPLIGITAFCWAVGMLIAAFAREVPPESGDVRLALSLAFALFLAFVGLAYFQNPGTAARRWMWRVAFLFLALYFGGGIAVFLAAHV